jgi:hypothetical protein
MDAMRATTRLKARICNVFSHISWSEASGALGDLGTFLPLVVALTQAIQLDLGTTLWFTGVYNVITGLMYDVPIQLPPSRYPAQGCPSLR